jgi:anti-anti-sigma factor
MSEDEAPVGAAFRLEIDKRKGVTVITVHGDVDHQEAEALQVAIQTTAQPVVVDLRHCTFMGSAGFLALLTGRRALQEREQRFVVTFREDGRAVARLFEIVGARQMLPLYESPDDAVAAAALRDTRSGVDRRAT